MSSRSTDPAFSSSSASLQPTHLPLSPTQDSLGVDDETLRRWWLERRQAATTKAKDPSVMTTAAPTLSPSISSYSRDDHAIQSPSNDIPTSRLEASSSFSSSRSRSFPLHQFRSRLPPSSPSPDTNDTYTVSLTPTHPSLHHSLLITPSLSLSPPPSPLCYLTAILHFPPSLIVDPYQLATLSQDGLLGVGHVFYGEGELERPDREGRRLTKQEKGEGKIEGVEEEGSGLVVWWEEGSEGEEMRVPVHARYLRPLVEGKEKGSEGTREVEVEWPWMGWVCPATETEEASNLPSLPPPFPPTSSISHLQNKTLHSLLPHSSSLLSNHLPTSQSHDLSDHPLILSVSIPVGSSSHLPFVEVATAAVVWVVAFWVGWAGWKAFVEAGEREKRLLEKGRKVD